MTTGATIDVTVTERAARKIGEILGREPAGTMLRVSVEGRLFRLSVQVRH